MNYTESLAYLDSLGKFGIKLGMERIEGLLRELGNPEQKIKTVHVTGTNGKGSVTSMITNILLAANLKVGKFTSPHLVKYNERINLNGKDISDEDFATAITAVKVAADSVVKKGVCEQPTQFEILTAAAFLYFYLQKVDYAVIEVGMGFHQRDYAGGQRYYQCCAGPYRPLRQNAGAHCYAEGRHYQGEGASGYCCRGQ